MRHCAICGGEDTLAQPCSLWLEGGKGKFVHEKCAREQGIRYKRTLTTILEVKQPRSWTDRLLLYLWRHYRPIAGGNR